MNYLNDIYFLLNVIIVILITSVFVQQYDIILECLMIY